MSGFDWFALVLVLIGGINWGLVGAFGFDLVDFLFGTFAWLVTLVYVLIGLAALYLVYYLFKAK
ncbi:DUF378 domain-containing protein [Nanoarchaeota archaeon]